MKKLCVIFFCFFTTSTIIFASNAEAQRYFSEAQSLYGKDRAGGWEKLNAALALDPDNLDFQGLRADWRFRELSDDAPLTDYLEILEEMFKIDMARPNSMNHILVKLQRGKLERAWGKASPENKKRLAAFCDKFRAALFKERLERLKIDTPARSLRDLENQEIFFCRMRELAIYYDMKKYKEDVRIGALEYLRRTDAFFRNPPKGIKYRLDPEVWIRYHLNFNWCTERDWTYRGISYSPDELEEYIKLAEKHPLKPVRGVGLLLELYNKTMRNNYDPKIFRNDVKTFALAFAELKLVPLKFNDTLKSYFWRERFRKHPELIPIADKVCKNIIPLWCKKSAALFFEEAREAPRAELPQFILDNRERIKALEPELADSMLRSHWYAYIAHPLLSRIDKNHDPKARKALDFLNRKMEIKLLATMENVVSNAILHGHELFYAYRNDEDLNVEAMNLEDFTIRRLYSYRTQLTKRCCIFRNYFSTGYALDCDDRFLVVGAEDAIHLFRLDGSKAETITDLPDPYVNAVAIFDKRIYAWLGNRSYRASAGRILFSCDLQGNKRMIHYNSRRGGKNTIKEIKTPEHFLEHFPNQIRGMLPDHKRKKLYFLTYDSLGIYDLDSNVYQAVKLKPECSGESWMMKVFQTMDDDKYYIGFGSDCVIYYPKTGKSEWVFAGHINGKNRAKYCYYDGFGPCGMFYVRKGQIWVVGGSGSCRFISSSSPELKEILFLPPFKEKSRLNINLAYPCPDGKSVVYLRGMDITKLTPREDIK
jgi:hypothetical protein